MIAENEFLSTQENQTACIWHFKDICFAGGRISTDLFIFCCINECSCFCKRNRHFKCSCLFKKLLVVMFLVHKICETFECDADFWSVELFY